VNILTVGDSFTYGDELDNTRDAWPQVLQNKMSCKLTNLAMPGTGNTSMVRTVIEHATNYDLIIVAWSHFARMEFADDFGIYDTWPGHRGIKFFDKLEYRMELLSYITKHHNDEYLYNQYLINIVLVQSYLSSINKKLIMLDAYGNNAPIRMLPEFIVIRNQINADNFLGWPRTTMSEWTHGTPHGPGGHFLEEGHAIVADKIYKHIQNLNWQ
jgi:hypothetical protein